MNLKNNPLLIFKFLKKKMTKNSLVKGSLVMFTGTIIANVGNYFYHLSMGRMLGPEGYGVLESVISVIYLLFIFVNTLALTVTKFVANLKGKKDFKGIKWLADYFNQRLFIYATLVSLIIFLASPLIASFLHLDSVIPILLAGLLFLVSAVSMTNRSILQGLLKFKKIAISHISETGTKVTAALILVSLGLGVNGAALALVIGSLIGYALATYFLKSLKRYLPRKPNFNKKTFIRFSVPVFFSYMSFTSLYTNDIILVKHFFNAYEAGLYASLAVLGKIIFFATSSISMVLFPMAADKHSQGKNTRSLLWFSLGIVFLVSLGGVVIYYFFPELMISLLFGKEYLVAAPILVWMAIFIALYALSFLMVQFFLSVDQTKAVFIPAIAALLQVILIVIFHNNLLTVIKVSIGVVSLSLLGLVLYYFYYYEQKIPFLRHRSRL